MSSSNKEKSSADGFVYRHPELKRKQEQIFRFLTGNREGNELTMKDIESLTEAFMSNNEIPQQKREQCATMFKDIWRSIFGDSDSATCEQVVEENAKMLTHQAGTYAIALMTLYRRMFQCVDFNDDNNIDFNEFMIYSKATGFKDQALMRRVFNALDVNGDGGISVDEYVNAYVKYEMDADVSLEDLPIYGLPNSGT